MTETRSLPLYKLCNKKAAPNTHNYDWACKEKADGESSFQILQGSMVTCREHGAQIFSHNGKDFECDEKFR